MAVDKEFLESVFEGIENPGERIGKVLAEYDSDIIGLKRNNEALKTEKEKLSEAQKALLKEKETLEERAKELNEKLESGLPDKEKQFFQAEVEKWKTNHSRLSEDTARQLSEKEELIRALNADHHKYILEAEVMKKIDAVQGLFPDQREPLKKLFFYDNPHAEFELVEYGGDKKYVNKASKSVDDILSAILNSPEGRRYRENQNTGGGAAGSGPSGGQGGMPRKQFEAMAPVQQADYMRKGGKLYD